MDYLQLIQQSIDYIENHIQEPLSVDTLAAQVGFSPYHYYRIFGEYVGVPVMEYIRKRRMMHAGYDLCTSHDRILDIAVAYGFDTHAGFTRAFRKSMKVSPEHYRREGVADAPERVDLRRVIRTALFGGMVMEPRIIENPRMKFVGYLLKTTNIDNRNTTEIPAFWCRYFSDGLAKKIMAQQGVIDEAEYGICLPSDYKNGEILYAITMETSSPELASPELFRCEINPCTYAVFLTPPADRDAFVPTIQKTWEYIYGTWFPKSGYEFAEGQADFERYDMRSCGDTNLVMEIYIPITKAKKQV